MTTPSSTAALLTPIRDAFDSGLGRVSMYRLVTLTLVALFLISIGYAQFGGLGEGLFTPGGQVITLGVLVVTVAGSSWLIGRLLAAPAHVESSLITALLLYFLFIGQSGGSHLMWIAVAGLAAGASKYLLAWRGRHIFNPAAAGAFVAYLLQRLLGVEPYFGASWWVASADLLPWVAVAAGMVLIRTRRIDIAVTFIAVAATLVTIGLQHFDQTWAASIRTAFEATALVFFAGFMLSEPLTLPPRKWQQHVVAAVMALVFAYPTVSYVAVAEPPFFGVGDQWQVMALLIGNLVAFAFARQSGVWLKFVESRDHGGEVCELVFAPSRPVTFEAGQYAELHVPHTAANKSLPDSRGTRRVFSIASPPGSDTVEFGLRVPTPASSLKEALGGLDVGQRIRISDVAGDFVLPRDPSIPVVLVAGGIGVTPFLSQLRHDPDRDAVLVYGLPSGESVPFAAALNNCRVVVVSPSRPSDVPEHWTWVESDRLTADVVADAVADLAERRAFVSGPPAMVNAVAPGLRRRAKSVRTDYFSGY